MIKITQVDRTHGKVTLTVKYDYKEANYTIQIPNHELLERMKKLRQLVGRTLTLQDLKDVFVALINEFRAGRQPLLTVFPYEDYIGVDLE